MSDTYNGYTNLETWAVFTVLSNDPYTASLFECAARGGRKIGLEKCREYGIEPTETTGLAAAADLLKEWAQEYRLDLTEPWGHDGMEGALSDLLSRAIHRVNWEELAATQEHVFQEAL